MAHFISLINVIYCQLRDKRSLDKFFEAVKIGNLADVKKFYNKKYVDTIYDGGNALHWTLMHNNKEVLEFLISEGCNLEETTTRDIVEKHVYEKARPIHIAAQYGDSKTISVLINAKCDLYCVTCTGETPLDIAIRNEKADCVEVLAAAMFQQKGRQDNNYLIYLVKHKNLWEIFNSKTGETLLDMLVANDGPGVTDSIKFKRVDEKEIEDMKSVTTVGMQEGSYRLLVECQLYRCIRQEYHRGFQMLCTPDMVNRDSLFRELTVLECTVKSQILSWVSHVLRRVYVVNESWVNAETIAKERNYVKIGKLMKTRRDYLSRTIARGFNRLHIAVYDNAPDMIDYLLDNELVNPDYGNGTVGSALSLAYELDNQDCIDCLHRHRVNTNTVDWLKRCPLTMAISNRNETASCDVLINNIVDIDDTKDYTQLTVMHRSILNDCEHICNKLLEKSMDYTKCIDMNSLQLDNDLDMVFFKKSSHIQLSHQETIFSLCFKAHRKLYPKVLAKINNINGNIKDGNGNTLLHLSATCLSHVTCSDLLSKNVNCNIVNGNNNTPLLEMLIQNYDSNNVEVRDDMMRTVRVLITGGASFNIKSGDGSSVFQIATNYNNERLLLELVCESQQQGSIERSDLEIWLQRGYFELVKTIIPLIDQLRLSQWITVDLIKSILNTASLSLVMEMFDKADPSVKAAVVETLLNKAATINDKVLFNYFIKTEISTESVVDDGQSLLSYLIREKKHEFIEILVSSNNKSFLLSRKDRNNSTPLHVCIECKDWTIINHFFTVNTPVDEEDNNGYTPLALLFLMISDTKEEGTIVNLVMHAQMLIREYADIYKVNKQNKTTISFLRNNDVKQTIEKFHQQRRQDIDSFKLMLKYNSMEIK